MCWPDIFSLITKLQDVVYTICLLIYTNIGIHTLHMQIVRFQVAQKSSLFFLAFLFFLFNAILATISHSRFASVFFGLRSYFSASGVEVGAGGGGGHVSTTLLVLTTSCFIDISRMKYMFSC